MSTPLSSATQHAAASSIARDQAESLARGNSRPDDGFWRDVFERAGGQAGMAGAGVAIRGDMPDGAHALRQGPDESPQGDACRPALTEEGNAGSPGQGGASADVDAAHARMPRCTATGLVALPHRTMVPDTPSMPQSGGNRGAADEASAGVQARPGGGAPPAAARLPAPVVVTVAAASSDEWRVYLRGQGLTPARALALASQAASGLDDSVGGAPARHVASVALNGRIIYSTSEQGGDDAAGSPSFSLTA